jgi:hypothetical protein
VVRIIFGPKRVEMVVGWGKLHKEELHNLHSLPNMMRMFKSRRMGWAWRIACMEKKRNA